MCFTTRYSIFTKLKDGDERAWEDFYRRYDPLIRLHGQDCGLKPDNLDDLVQNVMVSLMGQMSKFSYDPQKGRFRDYLRKIIRVKSMDIMRQIYKNEKEPLPQQEDLYLDDLFDSEWENYLRDESLKELKKQISARHYQIFYMLDVQNKPVREVATLTQQPIATIYSIRTRAEEIIKKIVEELDN